MKTLCVLIGTLILLGVSAIGARQLIFSRRQLPEPFDKISSTRHLSDRQDEKFFLNKVLIVNIWASWCAPCQQETPELLKFAELHPDDVVLLSVTQDKRAVDAKKFMDLFPNFRRPNVVVLLDEHREWSEYFRITGVPETFIFDRQLKLQRKIAGAIDFTGRDFLSAIEGLISTKTDCGDTHCKN